MYLIVRVVRWEMKRLDEHTYQRGELFTWNLEIRAHSCQAGMRRLAEEIADIADNVVSMEVFLAADVDRIDDTIDESVVDGGGLDCLDAPATEAIAETDIESLGLSVRCRRSLRRQRVDQIGQLCEKTEAELLGGKNFGRTSLREVKKKLAERDLSLKST